MSISKVNVSSTEHQIVGSPRYATCSTAAATVAKVASIADESSTFVLEKGVRICVKFTNANSVANPTLNVGSTGAKAIYWHGTALTSSQYWQAGAVVDFVYNETQWELVGVAKDNNTTYSVATSSANGLMSSDDKSKLDGIAKNANNYSLPTAGTSLGGVKTTSTVTSTTGLTACPIISGVPYYKDTNTTYSLSSFGINASATELNYTKGVTSSIQTQLNNKAASSHTHAYLPTAGGTMTGAVTTKGIKLTSGTDYGATLPSSPATNQLFFQTVGSNFVLDNVYPVGAVYMSMNSTNPGTLFGGTWEQVQGKFLLGASSSYPSGSSGGEEKHTLTESEMPSHKHVAFYGITGAVDDYLGGSAADYGLRRASYGSGSSTYETSLTGSGSAHNNMPPYLSVYIWYRTA